MKHPKHIKQFTRRSRRSLVFATLFLLPLFGSHVPSIEGTAGVSAADSLGTKRVSHVQLKNSAVSFSVSTIEGSTLTQPTSLQFGPDDRLYVLRKKAQFNILELERVGQNDYQLLGEESVSLARNIPNHHDDGTPFPEERDRQATGILVTGTASNPIVYIASSDPRVGGHKGNPDTGLDTNSGVISRLTWNGSSRDDPEGFWHKVDIVRGLPRSEENHAPNGMELSLDGQTMYLAVGGFTNAGAPSNNFAHITEYALSAAILSIDLAAIEAMPVKVDGEGESYIYDIPTLDDPTRPNANGIEDPENPSYDGIDVNDPWGGNDGLNQAKIVPGGPVQIHSPGYRNAYDVVIMRTPGREGRMYTVDNGANRGWGGHPLGEGTYPGEFAGQCTNNYDPDEPGSSTPGPNDDYVNNENGLHFVRELTPGEKYYAGHPTPIRGNPAGAGLFTGDYNVDPLLNTSVWRTGADPAFPLPVDWPPVPVEEANPAECDFRNAGVNDGSMVIYPISTNGIDEYTASNFDNVLKGNLFAVGYNENWLYRIELNEAGDQVLNGEEIFAQNFGNVSLDVTAQGDDDIFPGTMWVTGFNEHEIYIFEPGDYNGDVVPGCTGEVNPLLDEDEDGFDNEDEAQNNTNPCSAASHPPDRDGDFISDLNDDDDDNDTVLDINDAFAIDATNGTGLDLPVLLPLLNEDPATGFFGLGLTGLMTNGATDYLDQFIADELIPGGTAGLFTVALTTEGDATGMANTQENAFQFGVNVGESTGDFKIQIRMPGPYFNGVTPENDQSHGIYIGTGDMDNYVKLALHANGGEGGIQVLHEEGGIVLEDVIYPAPNATKATNIDLFMSIDPVLGKIQPSYILDSGALIVLGQKVTVMGDLLDVLQGNYEVQAGIPSALAIGLISTSAGPGEPFDATWDLIEVTEGPVIPSSLSAAPGSVAFSSVPVGGSSEQVIKLTNTLGNQKVNVSSVVLEGTDAGEFSHTFDDAVLLPVGANTSFDLTFQPTSVGPKSAQLKVNHTGTNNPLIIELTGSGSEPGSANPILVRVNAGGPLLLDGVNPVWQEDQSAASTTGDAEVGLPHPFVNAEETGDKTYGKNDPIILDASVAEGTPEALFQRSRWDPSADPHMQWDIPVAVGKNVELRLYFVEQVFVGPNNPVWASWPRVFDVMIEGELYSPLNGVDMFNDYGHDIGFMKSFVVVSDGNIDVDLLNIDGDPMIAGVEVVELTGPYSSVFEGWSLISVPATPEDPAYEQVFSNVAPDFAPYRWSGGKYEAAPTIAAGEALWVSTGVTAVQSYAGTTLEVASFDLDPGWNMIAGPNCELPLAAVEDPSGVIVPGTLYAYRDSYESAESFEVGRGYWINASAAGTITLDCSDAESLVAKFDDIVVLDDFGVLSVTDASGHSQELYFGGTLDTDVDRRRFSMPPGGPDGSFDVRFTAGSWLHEGEKAIVRLKGVQFPARVELSRMAVDFNGIAVVEQIVDGVVESQIMSVGDVLTIENERITAIRVRSMFDVQAELPDQFTLHGNYPNPFNPQTTLVFDLPEAARVRLTVYDLLGRRVMAVPEAEFSAGAARQINLDASSLASGTYLYHLQAETSAGSEVRVGRMTLLK